MRQIAAMLLLLAWALFVPLSAERAEAAGSICHTTWADVVSMIGYAADDVFGVDKSVLYAVAQLESGGRHCTSAGAFVIGDGGASVGVFQLHRWGVFGDAHPWRWMGPDARYDPLVNVFFAAWYLKSYGHMCPWTAYRVLYGGCAAR
jgi:hypothetical protein